MGWGPKSGECFVVMIQPSLALYPSVVLHSRTAMSNISYLLCQPQEISTELQSAVFRLLLSMHVYCRGWRYGDLANLLLPETRSTLGWQVEENLS
jgi:hypothetical protein